MDAKTYLQEKNAIAVEELMAIDAEYVPRRNDALAAITLAEKWMEELGVPVPGQYYFEPTLIIQDEVKAPDENWRSARDLMPKARAS